MHFLMHAWSHLGTDFDRFCCRKWSQVKTKVATKSKMVEKVAKTKKYYKNQWKKTIIFDVRMVFFWKKLGWKIDKKWSVNGKASWYRFLIIFGWFWPPSWTLKSKKSRYQRCWKNWWKKGCGKDESRVAILIVRGARPSGFESRRWG